MIKIAILLVLLSAVLHAVREFFTKKSRDKQIFVWWYKVFALIFFAPLFAYFFWKFENPPLSAWILGIASGVVHFFYWIFLSKSYESGDLSQVYPIMRSSPALVLIFAVIFFGEKVSPLGVAGILLVASGVYIINLKSLSWKCLRAPVAAIRESRATRFAFLTLLTATIYSLIDNAGVQNCHPLVFIYFISFFSFALFTPYVFLTKEKPAFWCEWRENKKSIVANGILVMSSYSLILIALTFAKVSYVTGLRQISVVFAVLLGGQLLREKSQKIRLIAALLIFLGAVLIAAEI